MKINIGCGMTPTIGWKNYDCSLSVRLSRFPTIIFLLRIFNLLDENQLNFIKFNQINEINYADVSKKLPLSNDSVELVYSSHMLEHLDRDRAIRCLNEVRRVLKVGGAL
jgi:SAM-dependent methyltransferase